MSIPAVVLDASVAAAWLLPDQASEASRSVYVRSRRGSLELHAPELWLWECGNIVAGAVRRQRLGADDALLTWSVLDAIRVRVEFTAPAPAQARAALVLGLDLGLSLYDAVYLWLAKSLRLPLLTIDAAMAKAARSADVTVVDMAALA